MPEREPSDHTDVTQVLDEYRAGGYAHDFGVEERGVLRCDCCGSTLAAERMAAHSVRRLEGASDPADMVAVVALQCGACEARGVVVLGFGPMASDDDVEVLSHLRRCDHVDVPAAASPAEVPTTG